VDLTKSALGQSEKEPRRLKRRVSFSTRLSFDLFSAHILTHTSSDFEKKFVCGEIMTYEDLREHGSEMAVKAAGKLRQQGKPYESAYLLVLYAEVR
jgi:hypothetical protein